MGYKTNPFLGEHHGDRMACMIMHVTTATTVTTVTVFIYIYTFIIYIHTHMISYVCVSENWVYPKNGPFNRENYDEP